MPVSMPSHIAGATAGAASTFAGRAAGENWSKASAISGAVATVAEAVTATASARARRAELRSVPPAIAAANRLAQSMIPITAAKLSCQPTSPSARGIDRQGDRRREQDRVPARARSVGQSRDQPGGPHDPGSLDRGARPSDRHVDRDQAEGADQSRSQRQPEQRQQRPGQDAEQDHVLAADREQVGQVRALEVLAGPLVDPVVLPEDETARERGLPLGHPATEGLLRALTDLVDPAGQAATTTRAAARSGRSAASSRCPDAAGTRPATAPASRASPRRGSRTQPAGRPPAPARPPGPAPRASQPARSTSAVPPRHPGHEAIHT